MNLEEKNREKRRKASLTREEWLTFFFIPFLATNRLTINSNFIKSEEERFVRYGYENKQKEASKVKIFGFIFYGFLFVILMALIDIY